jgi:hAT family C-terminal dimerisation region
LRAYRCVVYAPVFLYAQYAYGSTCEHVAPRSDLSRPQTLTVLFPRQLQWQTLREGDRTVVKLAPVRARVNFWAQHASARYPKLAPLAVRLLGMHATSCASERNWSIWGNIYTKARSSLALSRAEKLVYVRGNSKADPAAGKDDEEVMLRVLDVL